MYTWKRNIDGASDLNTWLRPNDNGDIDNHTASGRWTYRIVSEVWGEEKVVVMEEGNAILEQLVQSYPVLQIERKSGQPDWKQVIKGG